MTREEREEAINEIKQIQCFDKPFDNSVEECNKFVKREMALNMAIKALEQGPILDKIRVEIEEKARPNEIGGRGNGKSIRYGLCMALQIIDKYKAESEGE